MSDKDNPTWPYNQDIFPPPDVLKTYPDFEPLIRNLAISEAFLRYEKQATRLKRLYARLGKYALYCIATVMILLDYRVTLPNAPLAAETRWVAAVLGVAGLVFLAIMYGRHVKNRWLLQRYAAERIRCLKFQAFFLLADHGADSLSAAVGDFTQEGLGEISREVDGRSQFRGFTVSDVKLPRGGTLGTWAAARSQKAAALYDTLRFKWQRNHLEEQGKLAEGELLAPNSIGNAAFLLGAGLAVLDLFSSFAGQFISHKFEIPGLDFLTLLAFIISATAAVFERGDANLAHADRYARYASEIVRLRARLDQGGEFLGLVHEMERNALLELRDFCRDIQQSSYIV
jgi:hypothetical protein